MLITIKFKIFNFQQFFQKFFKFFQKKRLFNLFIYFFFLKKISKLTLFSQKLFIRRIVVIKAPFHFKLFKHLLCYKYYITFFKLSAPLFLKLIIFNILKNFFFFFKCTVVGIYKKKILKFNSLMLTW